MVRSAETDYVTGVELVTVVNDVGRYGRQVLQGIAAREVAVGRGIRIPAEQVDVVLHLQVRGTHTCRVVRTGGGTGTCLHHDLQGRRGGHSACGG